MKLDDKKAVMIRLGTRFLRGPLLAALAFLVHAAHAQDAGDANSELVEASNAYRLSIGDMIQIDVFQEPELGIKQIIDDRGVIRANLIGEIKLDGYTLREAEKVLEQRYIDDRMLRNPVIRMAIVKYAPKEVYLIGQFNSGGVYTFPPNVQSMEISELITKSGGMSGIARTRSVQVTRKDDPENPFRVDVQAILQGKAKDSEPIMIYPGDRLFVGERWY